MANEPLSKLTGMHGRSRGTAEITEIQANRRAAMREHIYTKHLGMPPDKAEAALIRYKERLGF